MKKYIGRLYLNARFYSVGIGLAILFLFSYFFSWLFIISIIMSLLAIALFIVDYILLFSAKNAIQLSRNVNKRLSNGDENPITIIIESKYNFPIDTVIIDEAPKQFQYRNLNFKVSLEPNHSETIQYKVKPVERGVYSFGNINAFISTKIGFLQRRYVQDAAIDVAVYPSYLKLRQYQILALNDQKAKIGQKRIRKSGASMEFEQIKEYIPGDDYRFVNWKATARRNTLMVNQYIDEKSQSIYCIIDKGRLMEFPFKGMTLLDYSINASLVISSVALLKDDKAGLLTFSDKNGQMLIAEKKSNQMTRIQELLYRQKSLFLDSDYEKLFIRVKEKITQRSLLLLYTNFNTIHGMRRQLPILRKLNKRHLLVVIIFENEPLNDLAKQPANNVKEIYEQTIAQQFGYEKRLIIKELNSNGILTILTSPENLTINALNTYLDIKNKRLI